MTFKEKEKVFKEIEKTKGTIAFELQKLEASIEAIALKNIEFEVNHPELPPF